MSDNLMTIKESAKYLRVHWQSIRNYLKSGKLRSSRIGKNIRIRKSELDNLLAGNITRSQVELEIRYMSKNRSLIEKRLINLGAKVVNHSHVIDNWYVPCHIKSMEQKNEWYDSAKGFGLRIREVDNGYTGKKMYSLEVKRLIEEGRHEKTLESSVDILNPDDASSVLNMMDFKQIIVIDKDRLVYKLGEFKVVLDDIKGFIQAVISKFF